MNNFFKKVLIFIVTISLIVPILNLAGCAAPEEPDLFMRLLKMIPADEDVGENLIIINNYALAFEDIGISLVELDEQSVTFQEFTDLIRENEVKPAGILMGLGSFITGWGAYANEGIIIDKNIGYNYASLDAEIQAGAPPHEMVAAIGRYDSGATRDALQNQGEWPEWAEEAYDIEEYRGVTVHTWGDGYKIHIEQGEDSFFAPPHIDMLGRARPLAVTEDQLLYAPGLDKMKMMIDASQGNMESLADLPKYAEIVTRMSELELTAVMLGDDFLANANPSHYADYPGPRLKNFSTFGTAPGKDEQGTFAAVVLYHENPEDAKANVSLLEERINTTDSIAYEQPWSTLITGTDIQVEGHLMIAKLYTFNVRIWSNLIYGADPLLLHEE